ncbi:serine/threonine protein kinase [Luteolibacter yonseiensis]|uniref:Serine/threonine protein kinase n=1 Tax=Luteolibacter yonseiensis TaxID=1144680 RepID=A0A934RAE5_9BACT|nr:serine/threonine-protein kinase [Luteolibacter yonseiensis]MBK1818110.1 serine/threonine protein kinase [Luteolibacter yonseiensis]
MDPSEGRRARRDPRKEIEGAILETALGLEDPEAREVFLRQWFGNDPEGLERMRGLLKASAESASFFMEAREHRVSAARDAVEDMEPIQVAGVISPPIEGPGSHIGPYRLLGRIGEGGCGVVYEAAQDEPVSRKVALKIIRLGMDTEAVIARFEVERQALALMDHRNIARVLDAGATDTGRPYFVMELVKGERITRYCDAHRLDLPQRLELFIQVCHAIQHAHQKGIIHRDIKPSNILVESPDGVAVPKVIDFGIAKAAGADHQGRTQITERDQIIGTPAYMSPEQVDLRGIDIDTRSDIYSLGVLLYELLSGRPPFDEAALEKAGMSEMRRALLEDDPPVPSQRPAGEVVAENRRTDPSRLQSTLRGDLDAIVMKAMEKLRNRRYQTVNSLAMDVRRYLAHEPVLARRAGRLYHIGKFVRRNRVACLSGAAVAVSLVGGMGASTWLYVRERAAFSEQKRLAWEAEIARNKEFHLLEQAEARASISQVAGLLNRRQTGVSLSADNDFGGVAILLNEGKAEEADALLRENPLDSIEPSPDATRVFRTLGHWNAMRGRWHQALRCFQWLDQANRFDNIEGIIEGTDPMCLATLLAEFGKEEDYKKFRREALDRYLPVRSALAAEHLLKITLLRPLEAVELERLRQAAEMCASGRRSEYSGRDSFPQWDALALTMFHHRSGESRKVLEWSDRCFSFSGGRGDRERSTRCLRAISLHRLGDRDAALGQLAHARTLTPPPSGPEEELKLDIWLDWSVSRVLLKEAEAVAAE